MERLGGTPPEPPSTALFLPAQSKSWRNVAKATVDPTGGRPQGHEGQADHPAAGSAAGSACSGGVEDLVEGREGGASSSDLLEGRHDVVADLRRLGDRVARVATKA